MHNKVCVNKPLFFISVFVIFLLAVVVLNSKLSSTDVSYKSRASEVKEVPVPVAPLKVYFDIDEIQEDSTFNSIFNGLTDSDGRVFLKSQVDYVICMNNTSTDKKIRTANLESNFSIKIVNHEGVDVNPTQVTSKVEDGVFSCRRVRFNKSDSYLVNGKFTPKIDGYTKKFETKISADVVTPNSDLKAYFVISAPSNGSYSTIYHGKDKNDAKRTTIYMKPGVDYAVAIENNSIDEEVWDITADKYMNNASRYWSFSAPGANIDIIDGIQSYWKVNYAKAGTYVMSGNFKPTVNGYVKKLPAKLTVVVEDAE